MLTSSSRKLHCTVADLLQWSDKILLDGDTPTVDTQQASDVISAVRHAVNVCLYIVMAVVVVGLIN